MSFLYHYLTEIKLPKMGPKSIEALQDRGLVKVMDLMFFFPLSYQFKHKISQASDLKGEQPALIEGLITQVKPTAKRLSVLLKMDDDQYVDLVFFHQSFWLAQKLRLGKKIRAYGILSETYNGWQIIHPEIQFLEVEYQFAPAIEPVYPKMKSLTSATIKKAMSAVLEKINALPDRFDQIKNCWRMIHAINLTADEMSNFEALLKKAKDDLAFLEAIHFFGHLHERALVQQRPGPLLQPGSLTQQLLETLPFELTQGQKDVYQDILGDLRSEVVMHRLVQGDVGSGKTIIGFLALACAYDAGYQSAMMAPTEILAKQHFDLLRGLLPNIQHQIGYLSGSLSASAKKELLLQIKNNQIVMVIGTQALFQDAVHFHNLGLAVIDEQHRFGVAQRSALIEKSERAVHHLTLSATPIPRTLAMALYGHLKISALKEKPVGRQPIKTFTLSRSKLSIAYGSVRNCVAKGMQCYWVCPLIEQSEHVQAQAVENSFHVLKEQLPELRIEALHGRLPVNDRLRLIQDFREGHIDLLVSTLVIEVGVNNPNATLMVIESPERLGLAQLHQLRGRVGRGHKESYCLLIYPDHLNENGIARISALCDYDDGFELSQVDLSIRGPGDLLGLKQSGFKQFRFFDFNAHQSFVEPALKMLRDLDQSHYTFLEEAFGQIAVESFES